MQTSSFLSAFRGSLIVLLLTVNTSSGVARGQEILDAVTLQTDVVTREAWLAASLQERVQLAEHIGEEGARRFAKSRGWMTIFDGFEKGIAQGPDQVYMAADGLVHVVEAKGGTGQLGHAYGHQQGSSEWAVESARSTLQRPAATTTQKAAAKWILDAAKDGRLQVHVIRTSHTLGIPDAPSLERSLLVSSEAKKLALSGLDEIVGTTAGVAATPLPPISRSASKPPSIPKATTARAATARASGLASISDDLVSPVLSSVTKAAGPVAIAVDAVVRIGEVGEAERLCSEGQITPGERDRVVSRNVVGFAGSAAGAAGGAYGGAAIGTMICPGFGTMIGAFIGTLFGSASGGACGEVIGEAMAN
jgi:hypothetical protein